MKNKLKGYKTGLIISIVLIILIQIKLLASRFSPLTNGDHILILILNLCLIYQTGVLALLLRAYNEKKYILNVVYLSLVIKIVYAILHFPGLRLDLKSQLLMIPPAIIGLILPLVLITAKGTKISGYVRLIGIGSFVVLFLNTITPFVITSFKLLPYSNFINIIFPIFILIALIRIEQKEKKEVIETV